MRKFFKTLDQKILRSSPILWNNHLILVVGGVLLLHLLFYLFGYSSGEFVLHSIYSIDKYFTQSWYMFFYVVLAVLLLVGFGFRYYTHNPLLHLYPLSRSYFLKVYLYLTLFVLTLLMVPYSYDQGLASNIKNNYKLSEVQTDLRKALDALPMIYLANGDKSYFGIKNRNYPAPFPLDVVSPGVRNSKPIMKSVPPEERLEDDMYDATQYDTYDIDSSKPYVVFEGLPFQFGTMVPQYSEDSCKQKSKLEDIQDVSGVYGLAKFSLYNFTPEGNYTTLKIDTLDYLKTLHQKLQNRDRATLIEDLQWYKDNMIPKRQDKEDLVPEIIAKKALNSLENGMQPERDIDRRYINTSFSFFYSIDVAFTDLGLKDFFKNKFLNFLIASILIALILMLSKYVPTIPFILSSVLTSVLFFLFVMIVVAYTSVYKHISYDVLPVLIIASVYVFIILAVTFIRFSKNKSQKKAYYLSVPASAAAIIWPSLVYMLILELTRELDPCAAYYSHIYLWEPQAWHFLVLIFLSSFVVFYIIKKCRTLAE